MIKNKLHTSIYTKLKPLVLAMASIIPVSAFADILVDPNQQQRPGMAEAANGTPVININDPNNNGISHNKYAEFDVSQQGIIFNNSMQDGVSQTGGYLIKNENLSNEARVILNEVTGVKGSYLNGAIEVYGRNADVIIANENGIKVNGVSTVNANNLTLSTGRVNFDQEGNIHLAVHQGDVVVEDAGVNTDGLSYFDIISRSAVLSGEIAGSSDLKVVTGLNDYDVNSRAHSVRSNSADGTPQVAISGSHLGSMYGGRIQLISTESGAGVSHAGSIVGNNGIEITADGEISLASLVSQDENITVAGTRISLNKNAETGLGGVSAEGDIILSALADLAVNADVVTKNGTIRINAGSLLQSAASLLAKNNSRTSSSIPAIQINVADRYVISGKLYAVDSNGNPIVNSEVILSQGKYIVTVGDSVLDDAVVLSDATLSSTSGDISINAGALENNQGSIAAQKGSLVFNLSDSLLNNGIVQANGSIELKGRRLKNGGIFNTTDSLKLTLGALENSGAMYADRIEVVTDDLTNEGMIIADNGDLSLNVQGDNDVVNSGTLQAKNSEMTTVGDLINQGNIVVSDSLTVVTENLTNTNNIISQGGMVLISDSEINNQGEQALISATKSLSITGKNANTLIVNNSNKAVIQSTEGDVNINDIRKLNIEDSSILSAEKLKISDVSNVTNQNGLLQGKTIELTRLTQLDNTGNDAKIVADSLLTVSDVENFENSQGNMSSYGDMSFDNINSILNHSGAISSNNNMAFSNAYLLKNAENANISSLYGEVLFESILNLRNLSGSVIEAQQEIKMLNADAVENSSDSSILSVGNVTFSQLNELNNAGQILSGLRLLLDGVDKLLNEGAQAALQGLDIIISKASNIINRNDAGISASNSVKLTDINKLVNEAAAYIQADVINIDAGEASNSGYGTSIYASDELSIKSDKVINVDDGGIGSDNNLLIDAKTIYNDTGGDIRGANYTLIAESLTNKSAISSGSAFGNSSIDVTSLDNTGGIINNTGDLIINTSYLNNSENGNIYGGNLLSVSFDGDYNNNDNNIYSNNKLSINTTGGVIIDRALESKASLFINAKNIYNNYSIVSLNDIYLTATNIVNNINSLIFSMKDMYLSATDTITNNVKGNILSQQEMHLSADTIHNLAGVIRSEGNMWLDANKIHNESTYKGADWDYSAIESGTDTYSESGFAWYKSHTIVFNIPGLTSDISRDVLAEISSGSELYINQNSEDFGVINNDGGLIQSSGSMYVSGDVYNVPKYLDISLYDYLNNSLSQQIELSFLHDIVLSPDFEYKLTFNSVYDMLDFIYGNGSNYSHSGNYNKVNSDAYGKYSSVLQTLANSHTLLNQLMSKMFGETWKSSSYDSLKQKWSTLISDQNAGLKDSKYYLLPAEKASIVVGKDFVHTNGSFNNGIASEVSEDVKKNTTVNVVVGDQEVTTIEQGYEVTFNKKNLAEIAMGISTLPTISSMTEIKGLFQKSQSFLDILANASSLATGDVTSGTTSGKVIPMYETRGDMIDQSQYYGSDYFFKSVGYDSEQPVIVIGDNYFISELIRRQLNDSVGSFFSVQYNIEGADLVKMLYDNAGEVASSDAGSSFVIGQALTQEQIAGLEKDIVWFVTESVDGVDVLVPRIYLASQTIEDIQVVNETGAAVVHAGSNVSVDADNIQNSNAVISAGNNVSLQAENDINNISSGMNSGIQAGGAVSISSESGNITNSGSQISAGEDISLSTEQGNIELIASAGRDDEGNQSIGAYEDGLSAGGNIDIKAKEVDITGISITGGESEDSEIRITSTEGNVNFNDVHEVKSSYEREHESSGVFTHRTEETTEATANSKTNTVNTGGAFIVDAAKDAVFVGGEYNAGSGSISAGEDVTFKTSQDHAFKETKITESSLEFGYGVNVPGYELNGGDSSLNGSYSSTDVTDYTSAGSESALNTSSTKRPGAAPTSDAASFKAGMQTTETTTTEFSTTNKNANFNFGNGVDINSSGTVDIGGIDISAGDTATINISATDIKSTKYEDVHTISEETKTTFIGVKGEGHSSLVDSANKVENLYNKATQDEMEINGIKTAAEVGGDVSNLVMNDLAGGSVSVGWSQETESSSSASKSENVNHISGGTINLNSKNDTTLKGVEINANEVNVDAGGDFSVSSAESTYTESSSSSLHNAGLSWSGGGGLTGIGAGASYDYSGSTTSTEINATEHTNSSINAGNVNVKTGGDMNLAGANINADEANLNIDGDLNISSVQDMYSETTEKKNWGASVGIAVSTSGVLPTVAGSGGGGSESHENKITAEQSGIHTSGSLNVQTGGDLNLEGAHAISDSQTGTVVVGGTVNAKDLLDTKDSSGMYEGGGAGISYKGTPTGNYYQDTIDEIHYKEEQHSTINVNVNGNVNGNLNTDAGNMSTETEDTKIAGNNISWTFSVPKSKSKSTEKAGSSDAKKPQTTTTTDSSSYATQTAGSSDAKKPQTTTTTDSSSYATQTAGSSDAKKPQTTTTTDSSSYATQTAGSSDAKKPQTTTTTDSSSYATQTAGSSDAKKPQTTTDSSDTNKAKQWPTVKPADGFVGGPGSSSAKDGMNNNGSAKPTNQNNNGNKHTANGSESPSGSSAQSGGSSTNQAKKWPTVKPADGFVGGPGSSSAKDGMNNNGSAKPANQNNSGDKNTEASHSGNSVDIAAQQGSDANPPKKWDTVQPSSGYNGGPGSSSAKDGMNNNGSAK